MHEIQHWMFLENIQMFHQHDAHAASFSQFFFSMIARIKNKELKIHPKSGTFLNGKRTFSKNEALRLIDFTLDPYESIKELHKKSHFRGAQEKNTPVRP